MIRKCAVVLKTVVNMPNVRFLAVKSRSRGYTVAIDSCDLLW
jgi:hypothetical protein